MTKNHSYGLMRIVGAPDEYDDEVACWACNPRCWCYDKRRRRYSTPLRLGRKVKSLHEHRSYSVMYSIWLEPREPRYWHVTNNMLTSVNETLPLSDHPVFNKWGKKINASKYNWTSSTHLHIIELPDSVPRLRDEDHTNDDNDTFDGDGYARSRTAWVGSVFRDPLTRLLLEHSWPHSFHTTFVQQWQEAVGMLGYTNKGSDDCFKREQSLGLLATISDEQLDLLTENVIEELRRRYGSLDEVMVDEFLLSMKHGLVQIQCVRERASQPIDITLSED